MSKMSILIICLIVAFSEAALHDFSLRDMLEDSEFMDHASRVVRSTDAAGYEVATLYGKSLETGEHRRLTKRDVEDHVASQSTESRNFELRLTSGEGLRMSLKKRNVLSSDLKVAELFENETIESRPLIRDCFFSGPLKNKSGYASLSLCDGNVVGAIHSKDRNFQLHPLPEDVTRNFNFPHVLLTWANVTDDELSSLGENFLDVPEDESQELSSQGDDLLDVPEDESQELSSLGDDFLDVPEDESQDEDTNVKKSQFKRSVSGKRLTIEVGVYLDQFYLNKVRGSLKISSNQQLTDLVARKWSGIAGVLYNPKLVGWDIKIKVVNLEIWRSNPSWYSTKELGQRLKMACSNTQKQPFDHVSIETADADPPQRMGLAYMGGVCRPAARCGISKGANNNFKIELHELGHNLGLKHDDGISQCSGNEKGFMSNVQNVFRRCYGQVFDSFFRDSKRSCLFRDNVNTRNYNPVKLG